MIRMPNTISCIGDKISTARGAHCAMNETTARNSSGTRVMNSAPRIVPSIEPSPPTMIAAR